ncbi:hypothetical protein PC129_g19917 [Phytophthora cactorum]|uniref:Uncharacterized protein n=1 Tax=Phytophthora cactorum TaxID=29920 RepID=A0A8T1AP63_9STRA|nr:hypothetical protein Pcac1_g13222 [Phytophthora cactorum]KAG2875485.1 hypothetical protein PC114_g24691 [Phytophthora cactorum]KAG2886940.1 hypothetical protein PC115_g20518 [Phytophthora cactorum]KAG3068706.1 hypothetical protein PC122_g16831 [Phytophthora cactorum]KAG3209063.1 hypothetical protein PC129_g19917 [Phytophthora cactorum]
MKPHPSLKHFLRVIEEFAREYVVLCKSIISGDATAPVRPPMRFTKAATLPNVSGIEESSSEDEDDVDIGSKNSDADSEVSDEDLGIVYDNSFDNEGDEEEKVDRA